ncbi:hypothetical protein NNL21_31450 [Paenibacillus mendelii]|nr:hypothetical protein [Paenibacillus mendelii]
MNERQKHKPLRRIERTTGAQAASLGLTNDRSTSRFAGLNERQEHKPLRRQNVLPIAVVPGLS